MLFNSQDSGSLSRCVFSATVLFVVLWVSVCSSAAGLTSIRGFPKAEVENDEITLGELIEIKSEDAALVQDLKAIVLAKAPLPGKSRRIDEDYIRIRLKQNGVDLTQINMEIPDGIEVSRSFVEISRENIRNIVQDFVYAHMPWEKKRANIKDIRVSHNAILPRGNITYKVVPPGKSDFLGIMPVSILLMVDGRCRKRAWATVDIEVLQEVVVSKRPLKRFRVITEEDVCLQIRELADLPSNIITDPEEVLGKRTRRVIDANSVLRADLIEFPPLVRRGDVVLIVAEADGLRVTALGMAKGKGCRGERLKVVNLDSNKWVYGRVLDSGTVEVSF